jgi:hypothetical protein
MVEDGIWHRLLDFCPLGNKICKRLGLDCFTWGEINVESVEFNCALRYASGCVSIVQDVSKWKVYYHSNLVAFKVVA